MTGTAFTKEREDSEGTTVSLKKEFLQEKKKWRNQLNSRRRALRLSTMPKAFGVGSETLQVNRCSGIMSTVPVMGVSRSNQCSCPCPTYNAGQLPCFSSFLYTQLRCPLNDYLTPCSADCHDAIFSAWVLD